MGAPEDVASSLWQVSHWPFVPVLTRLGLAVAIGLFIGLEREHHGKNGVRTFALTALLGCFTGNLVANPTLRETNAGTPVASATIAKNESLTRRNQDSVDLPVHPFSAAR